MRPGRRTRLKDVAALAGVTVSTASRALSRPEMVRPETRARVEAAARELEYAPNQAARGLSTGKYAAISMIVPDITISYFAEIFQAAQALARDRGYDLVLVDTLNDPMTESDALRSVSRWSLGVILCAPTRAYPPSPHGAPIVYVNRRARGSHAVVIDVAQALETQIGHLVALGHERITWIGGPKHLWYAASRLRFAQRLATRHDIRIVEATAADFRSGLEIAAAWDGATTAIVAYSDLQAIGIIHGALERGVRVPDDLSVVGSDDVVAAEYVYPPLTTVHASKQAMGRAAVSLLLDHRDDDQPMIVETMRGHLVVRGSTAPPR